MKCNQLSVGDKIRIRLPDGSISDAKVGLKNNVGQHFVIGDDDTFVLSSERPRSAKFHEFYDRVRLVYPIEQMENYKNKLLNSIDQSIKL